VIEVKLADSFPLAGEGWDGGMDKTRARELRKQMTEAERTLWKHLRLPQLGGLKFRRQHPIGKYIVDFVCLEKRSVVEVDGGQHSEQVRYDSEGSTWLKSQGFSMLRFWNNQALEELEAVKETIMGALMG
jgi:very-short-patch-repair endonuclease